MWIEYVVYQKQSRAAMSIGAIPPGRPLWTFDKDSCCVYFISFYVFVLQCTITYLDFGTLQTVNKPIVTLYHCLRSNAFKPPITGPTLHRSFGFTQSTSQKFGHTYSFKDFLYFYYFQHCRHI